MIKELISLFSIFTSSASSNKKKEKEYSKMDDQKFNYAVSCSAPQLCPVRVLVADFISESGTLSGNLGNSFHYAGMGEGRISLSSVDENFSSLPKAIVAIWASFVDRKVYGISLPLPYTQILDIFNKYEDIYGLDVCFLPGGKAIIYAKGGGRKVLLDFIGMGEIVTDEDVLKEIYMTYGCKNMQEYFDEYYSDSLKYKEKWISYFKKKGNPAIIFEKYIQRFNYKLNFEFEDSCVNNILIRSPFTNKECYRITQNYENEINNSAIITEIKALWDTKDFHYTCFMYFNEKEMLRVFDEAYGEDKTQKGEFKIKVGKDNNQFDISLNVGDKCIKLEKTEIDVFQDPIDDPDGDGTLIYDNYDERHNYFADDEKYVVD